MQAGEQWSQSSIVTNHRLRHGKKRCGKSVYLTYKDLKVKFGLHAATIREQKKELEKKRRVDDKSPPYWFPHPDLPGDEDGVYTS